MIRLFAQRQQLMHFLAQLGFHFAQPFVADRFALGSVRMNFAAIQAEVAQLQHPRHLRQQQDLHKQLVELGQKGLAKVRESVMGASLQLRGN